MSRPLPSPSDRAARLAERLEHQRKALEYLPIWFKAKNVSQRTIAEHIGVLESSLSKWISGKDQMPVGVLRQIATLIGAHEGDLLRPPEEAGIGKRVEETLSLMNGLSPTEWQTVMEVARAIRDARKP